MLRSIPSLALIALLLAACTQDPGEVADSAGQRPWAEWMTIHHPGPYRTVTVRGAEHERCITCHRFEELSSISSFLPAELQPQGGSGFSEPADPLHVGGTHPGGWLAWHDLNETGCVSCHGGNGLGMSYEDAQHDRMFDNRDELEGTPTRVLRESSCGRCHAGELVPAAPLLSEGRALIREFNCSACHDLPAWLSGGGGGPDLGRVGEKYSAELVAVLPNNVQHFKPGTRMPQFSLPDFEAAHIASFLTAGNDPAAREDLPTVSASDPSALRLLADARCVNCHQLPALPAGIDPASLPPEASGLWEMPQGGIGPSLERTGLRLSAGWIRDFLLDTHGWYPESRMPRYKLDREQASLLARWLVESSSPIVTDAPDAPDLSAAYSVEGNSLFIGRGCAGCHEIDGRSLKGNPVGPSLRGVGDKPMEQWQLKAPRIDNLFDYLYGNMSDPQSVGNTFMPRFDLDEHGKLAIVTALMAEPAGPDGRIPPMRKTQQQTGDPAAVTGDSHWRYPVPPQGSGDHTLSRLERDMHPESCAVCHREQYSDWLGTRHSLAMGPGVVGQIVDMDSANYSSCLKCHAVLSEQLHVRKLDGEWQDNPDYREDLYLTGVSCAGCHVRAHSRYAARDSFQKYPWDAEGLSAHPLKRSDFLQDSDFCWNCHQFDESRTIADGGPPLQNTNIEHREWQLETGDTRSCQDCHMPDGRHIFKGIHHAEYVRESLDINALLSGSPHSLAADVSIHTRDVGHYFPTYVTPAVFVEMELLDTAGVALEGSQQQHRIQRDARTRRDDEGRSEWYDHADTRIPPGQTARYSFSIDNASFPGAVVARITVRVEPDYFYHHSYERWVGDQKRSEAGRKLLQQALEETSRESSGYILYETSLDLP